jgi:hypothetical protein
MTRPRLSSAARERLAEMRRAEERERTLRIVERDVTALERIARQLLLLRIARDKGKISEDRCRRQVDRLKAQLAEMRLGRSQDSQPLPPAM